MCAVRAIGILCIHIQKLVPLYCLLKGTVLGLKLCICQCLVLRLYPNEAKQSEEKIIKILELYSVLECCQFKKFWEDLSENKEVAECVPDFERAVRDCEYATTQFIQRVLATINKMYVSIL